MRTNLLPPLGEVPGLVLRKERLCTAWVKSRSLFQTKQLLWYELAFNAADQPAAWMRSTKA